MKSRRLLLPALAVLAGLGFAASLATGPAAIGPGLLIEALLGGQAGAAAAIVQEIRLPRAVLGLAIGATLGLAGAALQGWLRNPLAEPGLIGVSASAALGAVLAFYFGLAAAFPLALPAGGMAGACLSVLLVQALAGRRAGATTVILAGVAVTSLASALTALALNLAPNPFAALEIVFWLLGSFADRSMEHVWLAAPFMAAGWALLASAARPLDGLTLGGDTAATLGIDLTGLRRRLVFGVALSVGAATAVAGAVGFVGLVAPHLVRPLVGHLPSRVLPASALAGAALVLAADVAVRLASPGREIKLGVVTALVGAPFFLYLVLRMRRRFP